MADVIDLANDLIANEMKRKLDEIRERASQPVKRTKLCIECDDLIPEERQKLGFNLCVRCAEDAERKGSLFAD